MAKKTKQRHLYSIKKVLIAYQYIKYSYCTQIPLMFHVESRFKRWESAGAPYTNSLAVVRHARNHSNLSIHSTSIGWNLLGQNRNANVNKCNATGVCNSRVISLKRSNIADNISEDKSQYTNERFAKESPAGKAKLISKEAI